MSWHISPWVYLVCDFLHFPDMGDYFLSRVREVFDYNLLKYFLRLFLFLFFFWEPYNSNVGMFNIVLEVSETMSVLFSVFALFCSSEVISRILCSGSLIYISASDILLLIPSRVFLFSVIVLFVSVSSFFNSSRSF